MTLQFEHVLAGVGMRRREIQREAAIDQLAVRLAEAREVGVARPRHAAEQDRGDLRHRRPGDPHDADAAAPGAVAMAARRWCRCGS